MEGEEDGAKKGSKVRRSFVVDLKVSERVRERLEESDDGRKGRDIGGGGAVFERGEVDVPVVNSDEYVLVTVHRFDGESARQIGRGPLILGKSARETG